MAELVKDFWAGMPIGMYVILILCFLLLVASWIAPPLAVISKSALQGTALILAAAWLFYITCHIPQILASGARIRATYGNASLEIGRHKKQKFEEEFKGEYNNENEENIEVNDTETTD